MIKRSELLARVLTHIRDHSLTPFDTLNALIAQGKANLWVLTEVLSYSLHQRVEEDLPHAPSPDALTDMTWHWFEVLHYELCVNEALESVA